MTNFIDHSNPQGLQRLSGEISNYSSTRESASFVFTRSDQTKFGMIAVAASLAGMSGQAMAVASNASAMEEEADYVQFTIDGKKVSGWLWRSPFKDGDKVEVAAEWRRDHYELLGMTRPSDQTVALYPHCTRSKKNHIWNAVKWWIYVSLFFDLGMIAITSSFDTISFKQVWSGALTNGVSAVIAGMHVAIAIAVYSMTRQWMPYARIAEKVFSTLGLPKPEATDLVKSSKGRHQSYDSFEFGSMYFRY